MVRADGPSHLSRLGYADGETECRFEAGKIDQIITLGLGWTMILMDILQVTMQDLRFGFRANHAQLDRPRESALRQGIIERAVSKSPLTGWLSLHVAVPLVFEKISSGSSS